MGVRFCPSFILVFFMRSTEDYLSQNNNKLSIENLNLNKKKLLIRSDLNVPINKLIIKDNRRIVGVLPTIKYALEQGAASVTLMSHLGRPKGKKKDSLSLRDIA